MAAAIVLTVGALMGQLMRRDREQAGLSLEQAAQRVGVPPTLYREIEAGERWPDFGTFERIERLYGWPRSFVPADAARASP